MIDILIKALQPLYPVYANFAPSNCSDEAYAVVRPIAAMRGDVPIAGPTLVHECTAGVYCRSASAEASYNMACAAIRVLDGYAALGTNLVADMAYTGAVVAGQYEVAITVTYNQGGV